MQKSWRKVMRMAKQIVSKIQSSNYMVSSTQVSSKGKYFLWRFGEYVGSEASAGVAIIPTYRPHCLLR